MNKEEVLAFIESCNSNADCAEIQKAAKERRAAIRNAAYQTQVDEYWKRESSFAKDKLFTVPQTELSSVALYSVGTNAPFTRLKPEEESFYG